MKKFSVIINNSVPSCSVKMLIWDSINNMWKYEYEVTIPDSISIDEDGCFSKELYVYGHIQELLLVESVTKNSVNLKVKSKGDILRMLDDQYREDMEYRRRWISNNPEYYSKVNEVLLDNKTQESKYRHIIFIKEQLENQTLFIAAPQKGVK